MRIAHGIGIVALLALMAWVLLAKLPDPRDAPTGPSETRVEIAPAGGIVRTEAPLPAPAPPMIPPGEGALLRVIARDPYGVLHTPHRIWVRQEPRNTEPDWIRDGDVLLTRLEVGSPPPDHLFLFMERPDHPLARASCTPSTQASMEGYEAELDLESGVAVVRVTVRGASQLPSGVWTADVRPPFWRTPLEVQAREGDPVTILAPAGGVMEFRLGPRSSSVHHSTLQLQAGRIEHFIEVPDEALGR
jgi:hypothetical protein